MLLVVVRIQVVSLFQQGAAEEIAARLFPQIGEGQVIQPVSFIPSPFLFADQGG